LDCLKRVMQGAAVGIVGRQHEGAEKVQRGSKNGAEGQFGGGKSEGL